MPVWLARGRFWIVWTWELEERLEELPVLLVLAAHRTRLAKGGAEDHWAGGVVEEATQWQSLTMLIGYGTEGSAWSASQSLICHHKRATRIGGEVEIL